MHGGTDEECIEQFDDVRSVFEGLFRTIEFERSEQVDFAKALATLTGKRGRSRRSEVWTSRLRLAQLLRYRRSGATRVL